MTVQPQTRTARLTKSAWFHRPATPRADAWWVAVILLAALLAAKLVMVLSLGRPELELDALHYFQMGELVVAGDAWLSQKPIAYRTPVYPWVIGVVIRLTDDALHSMAQLQAILCGLTVVLAGWLAVQCGTTVRDMDRLPPDSAQQNTSPDSRPTPTRTKWLLPGVMAVMLPTVSATVYVNVLLTEIWFTLCLVVHLIAVLQHGLRPTTGTSLAVGVTFVLTLLTRPIVMLLWVAHVIFWALLWWPQRQTFRIGHLAWTSMVTVLTIVGLMTPWLSRNEQMFGDAFVTKFVGRNLWIVTFQPGSGAGLPVRDSMDSRELLATMELTPALANDMPMTQALTSWRHTWTTHTALANSEMADDDIDDLMKRVAMDSVRASPLAFGLKALRRMANFWRTAATDLPVAQPAPNASRWATWTRYWLDGRFSQYVWINTLIAATMALSVGYLVWHHDSRAIGLWLGLILAYFTAVTGALEIPDYRYRLVVEPIVAVTIVLAVGAWCSRLRQVEGTTA